MTAFALGLHSELVEERGINPTSDKYYQEIDNTMRKKFPEYFGSNEDDERSSSRKSEPAYEETPRRATKPATVVAPATRSTPPNRIRLKASQAAIARPTGCSAWNCMRKRLLNLREVNKWLNNRSALSREFEDRTATFQRTEAWRPPELLTNAG
jgi:hypothetical protein